MLTRWELRRPPRRGNLGRPGRAVGVASPGRPPAPRRLVDQALGDACEQAPDLSELLRRRVRLLRTIEYVRESFGVPLRFLLAPPVMHVAEQSPQPVRRGGRRPGAHPRTCSRETASVANSLAKVQYGLGSCSNRRGCGRPGYGSSASAPIAVSLNSASSTRFGATRPPSSRPTSGAFTSAPPSSATAIATGSTFLLPCRPCEWRATASKRSALHLIRNRTCYIIRNMVASTRILYAANTEIPAPADKGPGGSDA